ncbi:MAG: energy-coupling factor ABC transporter permease [Planctomycetaceae bacterium]
MHIPDGVLAPEVCAATGAISLGAIGYSLYKLKDSLADRTVPMTGMAAAVIFAGQMVNFPLIGAPVSGHLIGGVLAAAILGPYAGCIAVALVLLVQCLLFADGGWFALGANVLNMAVIGAMGGHVVFQSVRRWFGEGTGGTITGAVVASWLSVMAAAAVFCIEFGLSWRSADLSLSNLFALMVMYHSAIGIGEAVITGSVVAFVLAQRPDLIYEPAVTRSPLVGLGRVVLTGAVCALAVAAFLAPFAAEDPDGLEAVGQRVFPERLETEPTVLWLADYEVPLPWEGWQNSPLWKKVSVSLAGLIGTGAMLVLPVALSRTRRATVAGADDGK